ncbi:MAG: polymerase subunit delta [Actinomycetota bacterium]|nr:polymerase subunit delta [Actinomycetota bacterium]
MNVWDKLHRSRVIDGLAGQMESGAIPHAWLLLGPAGSGKGSAALAMAASLNCEVEPGIGCGTCSTCARIVRRRHPDVHHVVAEGQIIPVDLIREVVIPEAARSPFEGRFKVFIIEEAERMNPQAQNALLKTLEEPQPDTVFILLSGNEDEVLETIRSRCRIVRLEPVAEARIVEMLEEDGVSEESALLAARLADGDFDRARNLGEDEVVLRRRNFWIKVPPRLMSPVDAQDAAAEILAEAKVAVKDREKAQKQEIVELADAIGEGRGTGGARAALSKRHRRELRRLEEDVLGEALSSLASYYKDVVAIRVGSPDSVTNIDLLPELEAWAASDATTVDLLRAAERCIDVRASFVSNANASLAIEAALVEISARVRPPMAAAADWN